MKKSILASLLVLMSFNAHAETVASGSLAVAPSTVDQVVRLVDKTEAGSAQKKVSIVVTDSGLSTDVSPRYTVYFGYASFAEMGNITADFKVNDQAFKFVSAVRKSAGIYEFTVQELRVDGEDEKMFEVTYQIDASKMFSDEAKLRTSCGDGFCDGNFNTSVIVNEISSQAK